MVARERDLRKLGRKFGYTLERTRSGRHYRLVPPDGPAVIVAASASCHRATKNIEADLRRARRPAKERA